MTRAVTKPGAVHLVAFRADRQGRQLPVTASVAAYEFISRHWSNRFIEPLTARSVLAVEGPSDFILVRRVAELAGVDLDRRGIAVFDLDGAKLFPFAYEIFGPDGFDVCLAGMVDEDARGDWADAVGVAPGDLESAGYVVCDPDLEGVYVDALGVADVIGMLLVSPKISENSLKNYCAVADVTHITPEQLTGYCRKHKVAAALAVAAGITPAHAAILTPILDLLALAP